jgi:hypothetical protein
LPALFIFFLFCWVVAFLVNRSLKSYAST